MSSRFAYRRVVIGHGVAPGGERSIDLAVRLAGIAQAQLKGLFVEETSLFDLADLPFSKTLARGGQVFRNLDRTELQKAFAEQAAAFRRRLSLHAERLHISCEFVATKGDIIAALSAECQSGDIVVLSGISAGVTAPDLIAISRKVSGNVAGVVIAAETPERRQAPVVVIDQDGEKGRPLLDLGEEIARQTGRPLVVLCIGAEAPEAPAAGGALWRLEQADARDVAGALRRLRPWCVIGDRAGDLFRDDPGAGALIAAAAAPVLLLQAREP